MALQDDLFPAAPAFRWTVPNKKGPNGYALREARAACGAVAIVFVSAISGKLVVTVTDPREGGSTCGRAASLADAEAKAEEWLAKIAQRAATRGRHG